MTIFLEAILVPLELSLELSVCTTYLNWLRLVHAFVRLEVMAFPHILRPHLAAVAVVLPELLAHPLLLRRAFLDILDREGALLSAN